MYNQKKLSFIAGDWGFSYNSLQPYGTQVGDHMPRLLQVEYGNIMTQVPLISPADEAGHQLGLFSLAAHCEK